jgi:hypothetical protein
VVYPGWFFNTRLLQQIFSIYEHKGTIGYIFSSWETLHGGSKIYPVQQIASVLIPFIKMFPGVYCIERQLLCTVYEMFPENMDDLLLWQTCLSLGRQGQGIPEVLTLLIGKYTQKSFVDCRQKALHQVQSVEDRIAILLLSLYQAGEKI